MSVHAEWRRWGSTVLMGLAAILAVALGVLGLSRIERSQHEAAARTALSNFLQIEVIKDEIRDTVTASQARLPQVAYYRTHPDELKKALRDSAASVARFRKQDCYQLPLVKDFGLQEPGN
jgi:hypothetical protein